MNCACPRLRSASTSIDRGFVTHKSLPTYKCARICIVYRSGHTRTHDHTTLNTPVTVRSNTWECREGATSHAATNSTSWPSRSTRRPSRSDVTHGNSPTALVGTLR